MAILKKYAVEVKQWTELQNEVVGLFTFSFGLACLSMSGGQAVVASIASTTMAIIFGKKLFSRKPTALDKLASKENPTEQEKEMLEFADKNINALKNYYPFLFGFLFLLCVLIYKVATYVILGFLGSIQ